MEKKRIELLIKIFFRFLKEKGVYMQFLRNYNRGDLLHLYMELKKYKPVDWIGFAFFWSNTPQGRVFWSHINSEWIVSCTRAEKWMASKHSYLEKMPFEDFLK